jgi:hypothetical protein
MHRVQRAASAIALVAALLGPVSSALAAGPGPSETCVAGTIWEDPASGVKYICIYDEAYGGTRWELLSGGQTGGRAWLARSSSTGCALGTVGITSLGGSGAAAFVRSYRWPCTTAAHRLSQPAGELRIRVLVQRYDGGWATCRDTGYRYSTTAASAWTTGIDMGTAADCGAGTYRVWGFGALYQGGAWRGGALASPPLALR